MLVYQKSGLKVAEIFFDEPNQSSAADIVRYHYRSAPVSDTHNAGLQTLWIDLTSDPDAILAGMNADTRRKIRLASKDASAYEFQSAPDAAWMAEFCDFYDRFAKGKQLAPANRPRLGAMRSHGALDLSRMRAGDGEVLVWHAHVRGCERVRLLHSASIFRELDKDAANRISCANRLHHWADMQRFRAEGLATYDFGGWYAGADDTAKLRINGFKRGFGGAVVPQYNADCPGT